MPCLKSFNQIREQVEQPEYSYEGKVPSVSWTDELGRLRVWAANIGAHQTGQSSLEFRLRDASHISQQITKLLGDLHQIIDDVAEELSVDDAESSEDGIDAEDAWPDNVSTSELQQLYEEVVNIIDCLYQMSMLIRKPAQHDLLVGSRKSDAAAFEPFDKEHVRNKYLNADERMIQRLGGAITRRRKYLKYRERHHAKMGKGIEEIQGIQRTATDSLMSETIATDFKTGNIDFEETSSNSGMSQTSYAPSLMDGGAITIPPPPKESAAGKPFECPYCLFIIDIKGTRSWTRHIFKDIKPYVCTFSDCSTPDTLYDSRHEWFSHEKRDHHTESLICPLCKDTLISSKQFERHVARHLEELALFALPRSEMNDDHDEDELDARASSDEVNFAREISSDEPSEDDAEDENSVVQGTPVVAGDTEPVDIDRWNAEKFQGKGDLTASFDFDAESVSEKPIFRQALATPVAQVEGPPATGEFAVTDNWHGHRDGPRKGMIASPDEAITERLRTREDNKHQEAMYSERRAEERAELFVGPVEPMLREVRSYDRLPEDNAPRDYRSYRPRRHHSHNRDQDSYSESSSSSSGNSKIPQQPGVVTSSKPTRPPELRSILHAPRDKFPEDPAPLREGVTPHNNRVGNDVPPNARWTKIDRRLVNSEALEQDGVRFEEFVDHLIVLKVMDKEEIEKYAQRTAEIRGKRRLAMYGPETDKKMMSRSPSPEYHQLELERKMQRLGELEKELKKERDALLLRRQKPPEVVLGVCHPNFHLDNQHVYNDCG
ncbi:hypothetical protein MMC28_001999 [Mycoblastus sanguinarius]|nr:hypothetical protein [Mycoblastus sanguinarius]